MTLMARRKRSGLAQLGLPAVIACAALTIYIVVRFLGAVLLVVGILAAILIYAKVILPAQRRKRLLEETERCRQHILQVAEQTTENHLDALVRSYVKLVHYDEYGAPYLENWNDHLGRVFIPRHIHPRLSPSEQALLEKDNLDVSRRISEQVDAAKLERPAFPTISAVTTASEYEMFCSEQLALNGWESHRTPLCRDQGVDVIAQKNGTRVVLQCKLWSNPVGVSAVQEIVAGRGHYGAHHGAVVTNSRYTSDAAALARTNGILLLSHSDLPQLEKLLEERTAPAQQRIDWN